MLVQTQVQGHEVERDVVLKIALVTSDATVGGNKDGGIPPRHSLMRLWVSRNRIGAPQSLERPRCADRIDEVVSRRKSKGGLLGQEEQIGSLNFLSRVTGRFSSPIIKILRVFGP